MKYPWFVFSSVLTEVRDLLRKSQDFVKMWENANQRKLSFNIFHALYMFVDMTSFMARCTNCNETVHERCLGIKGVHIRTLATVG